LVFCRETGFLQFLAGNSVFLCRKPCNGAWNFHVFHRLTIMA
jgi:hypothetical protein